MRESTETQKVVAIVQPPAERLRNCLHVLGDISQRLPCECADGVEIEHAVDSAVRLVRDALTKLSEPSSYTVQIARDLLYGRSTVRDLPEKEWRVSRDYAAAILNAQVSGPPLTERPR